jgi:hypothetical protein
LSWFAAIPRDTSDLTDTRARIKRDLRLSTRPNQRIAMVVETLNRLP